MSIPNAGRFKASGNRDSRNARKHIKTLVGLVSTPLLALLWGITAYGQEPTVTFSSLYSFTGDLDGFHPVGGLSLTGAGDIYGTAEAGGTPFYPNGRGVVFRIDAAENEATLHRFKGGADGRYPMTNLIPDAQGGLYGTASGGGDFNCDSAFGCGLVFRLDPSGTESTFFTFHDPGGDAPFAGLLRDGAGNFYGTTAYGGIALCGSKRRGCGVAFQIDQSGNETVLHTFSGTPDGSEPENLLLRDQAGNLFGTTTQGGSHNVGVVFKIDPSGTETIIHNFTGKPDGATPSSSLIQDQAGNLYGTTRAGGSGNAGTIFKIDPEGNETVLYSFPGIPNVAFPSGNLIQDKAGNLYGTSEAGRGWGTVFRLGPNGKMILLHQFNQIDGWVPSGLVVKKASEGVYEMYGETGFGGAYGVGTVYKLTLSGGADFNVE